jgi:hypothetical protein
MAGFTSFDALVYARSSLGYGQDLYFNKVTAFSPGAAGQNWTLWAAPGLPAAGVYTGSAETAAQATDATTGGIGFTNAGTGRNLFAHSLSALCTSGTGTLILWDRLLYYPGLSHAPATLTMTNGVALPRYTTGAGVYAFLEVTTTLGANAHTCTLTYTDQSGNAGASTGAQTIIVSSAAERIPHAFRYFPLASGDTGIRSVQSVVFAGAGATGTSALVLAKPLAVVPLGTASIASVQDLLRGPQIALPEINDDACLMWTWHAASAGTTPTIDGTIFTAES